MDPILLNLIVQIWFLIIIVIFTFYLGFVLISFKNFIPYVPTPPKIAREMLRLANLKAGDKICDLGSGSGGIILEAVKKYPVIATGIEKSKSLYWISKIRLLFTFKKGQATFKNDDLFKTDLRECDAVFCFLVSKALDKLEPNFNEMRIGTKIITYMFPLKNNNFKENIFEVGKRDKIFTYQKLK